METECKAAYHVASLYTEVQLIINIAVSRLWGGICKTSPFMPIVPSAYERERQREASKQPFTVLTNAETSAAKEAERFIRTGRIKQRTKQTKALLLMKLCIIFCFQMTNKTNDDV